MLETSASRPCRRARVVARVGTSLGAIVAVGLLTAWLVLASSLAHATAGPSATPFSGSFKNAEGSRDYLGHLPSGYRPGTPLPLVVALHGCTQTATDLRNATRLDDLAESGTFITVYPEQSPAASPMRCWNWSSPAHQARGRGEPSLISGITDEVSRRWSVDPKRVFVMGLSSGGAMAVVMGATYPDRYAAIAVHSGCEYGGLPCGPSGGPDPVRQGALAHRAMGANARPVPVIVFHGDRDLTVPPVNGEQVVKQWISTDDHADDGRRNGSVPATRSSTVAGNRAGGHAYEIDYYADRTGSPLIEHWRVHGMGHAWSGGCACEPHTDAKGPDATTASYAFFRRHPKP